MSIAAVSWALNEVRGLRASEKAILIALADRADAEGYCFPSYTDIVERSGAHRETVALALKKFEELGLIQRKRRYSKSNEYYLCITQREPIRVEEKPKAKKTNDGFDDFWSAYPRKTAKKPAAQAWGALNQQDKKAATVGLTTYEFSKEARFIPHPATWIRQRRWEDVSVTISTGGLEI
jgi:pyocin large subunit-like protein